MAQRRMFSKTITNSSEFLMMPEGSQVLYFHLGMNADDDGFCEHFMVMRMTNCNPDNLKLLQAKGFIHVFDEKVLVILDWKENNYLRSDRYTPSRYLQFYNEQIKQIPHRQPIGIPSGDAGKDRIGKDRIGKDRIGKSNKKPVLPSSVDDCIEYAKSKGMIIDPVFFYNFFTESDWKDTRGNKVYNYKLKMQTWNKNEIEKRGNKQPLDTPESRAARADEIGRIIGE